ncbi:MAG: ATP-binding protein [Spirochaetota bacterium]
MHFPRLFAARLVAASAFSPVLVLTGPRQSGKTTLLKSCFPDHRYVSLDLPSVAEMAERDPSAFFAVHPGPLLIDEIQYAPGLFRHIKAAVDADRDSMGRFILTGSQSFTLMQGISDSLAGRCVWFELENLALAEIRDPGDSASRFLLGDAPDWPSLMVRGQYPELWKRLDLPHGDYFAAYIATYLERDVRQILRVTSLRDFERFMRLLAARSGQLLNKAELAKDVGVSPRAIADWIAVLEASGQIVLLEPWFRNFGKRIVKSPKLYFRDSGLLCWMLGLDARTLPSSPFIGAVWEGFVFAELRKLAAVDSARPHFWFYRDQASREIDLVIEVGGRLNFVETKWTESPAPRDYLTITKIAVELAASGAAEGPGRHWLVSRSPARGEMAAGIWATDPLGAASLLEPLR